LKRRPDGSIEPGSEEGVLKHIEDLKNLRC
jgi:hypothetical protein